MADALAVRVPIRIPGRLDVAALSPQARFSFRGAADAAMRAATGFGLALPTQPCRAVAADDRAALWLGPDEWLLLAPKAEEDGTEDALRAALADAPHALVRVGDRHAAMTIAGPRAEAVLAAGCALDLDAAAFPPGMCTRTLLAKAEIVLWRYRPDAFRLEFRRSFAAYAWDFVAEAAREHFAG
jgi:sarcosine oxidase subunit gamma